MALAPAEVLPEMMIIVERAGRAESSGWHPAVAAVRPLEEIRLAALIIPLLAVRIVSHAQPGPDLAAAEHPQAAPFRGGGILHGRQDGERHGMTIIVGPAVGMASRDRLVEFLLGGGGPLRPARHDLDRCEHRRAAIAGEQPRHQVVAGHPDGQPQVVQGGATAEDELAAQGSRHRKLPVPAHGEFGAVAEPGADVDAVLGDDPEIPGLGVVDGRRPLNGFKQPIDAVLIGERLQHRAPRL